MARQDERLPHAYDVQVRWQNFRSFRDTTWLDLKPLTVLIGANNSGKSSLIAPLLLLKQTMASSDPDTALLTNGDLLNLGTFPDVVHRRKPSEVVFGLRWHVHPPPEKHDPRGTDPPGAATFGFISQREHPSEAMLSRFDVFDTYRRPMLSRRLKGGMYSVDRLPVPARADADDTSIDTAAWEGVERDSPYHFVFTPQAIHSAVMDAAAASEESGHGPGFLPAPRAERLRYYEAITNTVLAAVDGFLDQIHYVGPLRERVQRVYRISGEMPTDVGTRGENAPEIIYRWRTDTRRLRALQSWLQRFGFRERLISTPLDDYAFELKLQDRRTKSETALTDLGFGLSQVLPLIVQALHGEPRSMLIAEQPEIHLNPRLQSVLADLFVSAISRRRRVIVETHSEHFLLRLRRLIAEGKLDSDLVGLYYVEKSGLSSRVRHVMIDGRGHIDPEAWPKGFFEEALDQSLGLAEAQVERGR